MCEYNFNVMRFIISRILLYDVLQAESIIAEEDDEEEDVEDDDEDLEGEGEEENSDDQVRRLIHYLEYMLCS